jgi:hypothetical protein
MQDVTSEYFPHSTASREQVEVSYCKSGKVAEMINRLPDAIDYWRPDNPLDCS